MKLDNIHVSGITRLVFVRAGTVWAKHEFCGLEYWVKESDASLPGDPTAIGDRSPCYDHCWIVRTIKHFTGRADAHVWVSGDTVNIRYPR